jgi:hypothetical protein
MALPLKASPLALPKGSQGPNTRLGAPTQNGRPAMASKFVFLPVAAQFSVRRPQAEPNLQGASGPALLVTRAKRHKYFPPFRLVTTVAAATTPRCDSLLLPVGTHSTAA